jgi:hypothetical protein
MTLHVRFCLQAIEQSSAVVSYAQLLEAMHNGMERLREKAAPGWSGILGRKLGAMRILGVGKQTPCICSNTPFELDCQVDL